MTFKDLKYLILTKTYGFYINMFAYANAEKASIKAFELFCRPRRGKIKTDKIPKILNAFEFETFEFENQQYQSYIRKGNDEIILLVHGWESNTSRWKKLMPYLLKTKKTIVAIDAPAHGLSSGIDFTVVHYTKVISAFTKKYNPTIVIGHSIGGLASIYYQYLNQNINVSKMIILGAPSDFRVIYNNYCRTLSLNSKVKTELEKRFSEKLTMKIDDFSGMKFASAIKTKTLIAHDNSDSVVLLAEGKKTASAMPDATFIVTENLGHAMHDKVLYEKLLSFIQED